MAQHKFTKVANLKDLAQMKELMKEEVTTKSAKKRTLAAALGRHIEEMNALKTKEQLVLFVQDLEGEVDDKIYFRMTMNVLIERTFMDDYKMLYDIYLKGQGLSLNNWD